MRRFLSTALIVLAPVLIAAAPTPAPGPTRVPIAVHRVPLHTYGSGLQRSAGVKTNVNGPVRASACMARSAPMPASTGTIRSNGPTQSDTLIAVPLTGGNVATQTRNAQIAEACAHQRH